MNPSTVLASVVVDELVRCGVRDAVLCPGSRNAPLSFALYAADVAGRLTLHVRIDERSAAFLALGLALRSGLPVPVVCTSGTAAANLHPAVLEAHHAGVPLLAVTADRPAELVGTGANQTIEQAGLFGPAVRAAPRLAEPRLAEHWPATGGLWRSAVDRALAAARGALGTAPGPVHLNVPFREPLVPQDSLAGQPPAGQPPAEQPLAGRGNAAAPWTEVPAATPADAEVELDLSRPTLVIAGHGAGPAPAGVPLVAEPTAGDWPLGLTAGPWLLSSPALRRLPPEQVLVLGRPSLHRGVQRLLADPAVAVTVLTRAPQWTDCAGNAVAVGTSLRITGAPDPRWLRCWQQADDEAARAVAAVLAEARQVEPHQAETHQAGAYQAQLPTGLEVARQLVTALPAASMLLLGSSNPIRDVALCARRPPAGLTVLANRGVAGIDGSVATAVGAALAHDGPSYALLGDLTFLHDANGLLIGPTETRPDLTIVVANDDGGGIFTLLEQGAPEYADSFERVFGTPHRADLAALCAAYRVSHVEVPLDQLPEVLHPVPGLRVVEVRTNRTVLRALHRRIRDAVRVAVTQHGADRADRADRAGQANRSGIRREVRR